MATFVSLNRTDSNTPFFVNPEMVARIEPDRNEPGNTNLRFVGEMEPIRVRGRIEEIFQKLNAPAPLPARRPIID